MSDTSSSRSSDENDMNIADNRPTVEDNNKKDGLNLANSSLSAPSNCTKSQLSKDHIARALQDASYGNESEHSINETLLYRSVCSAGAWAYGVMACEVWVLDHSRGDQLVRPSGGIWRDMVWPSTEALERLEDSSHPKYEEPIPLAAGEGLAGALWAEADTTFNNSNSENLFEYLKAARRDDDDSDDGGDEETGGAPNDGSKDFFGGQRKVIWRNIAALAADPDQPPNKRLALWAQAGFGLAAGVAFEVRGVKGIVVYMARESAAMDRLQSAQNEAYLISAADLIGAEAALGAARADAIYTHRQQRAAALRRAKMKMKTVLWMLRERKRQGTLDTFDISQLSFAPQPTDATNQDGKQVKHSGPSKVKQAQVAVKTWGKRQVTKAKGKDLDPPPPMQPDMALQTLCFVFITLMVIFRFNKWLTGINTADLSIMLGPVGAIATMHYTLMAAPASQPRNAIFGQLVSITIGILVSYVPPLGTEDWIRPAVATALAATAMVLLGITHPPGGATALSFSSGKFGWVDMGLLLVAYCMAITCSTFLNNLTEKRQYPMYWSFIPNSLMSKVRHVFCRPPTAGEEENNAKDKSVI